ncbi:MAG: ferrochelatase, partial [Proteobacteria bacterium]|nr:ferrochelatase [Pseudomonadota bacterium]
GFEIIVGLTLLLAPAKIFAEGPLRLGVFFGSYGDVDASNEIEELITSTLSDRDMVPLPAILRSLIAKAAWAFGQDKAKEEYRSIGKTNYRMISQQQADQVAGKLRESGYWAKGYTGFTFTFPHVAEGLKKAQKDGVNRLVVFYQGAQHSRVTSHIVFREVKNYLKFHPEWDVKVTAVSSFADDERFIDLVAQSIEDRRQLSFPNTPDEDLCVFLPVHGNYTTWIDQGDPSYRQMLFDIDALKQRFPLVDIHFGFQNHEEVPALQWTQPRVEDSIKELASAPCRKIIINGRVSFTIDNLETLYDQGVAQKKLIEDTALCYGKRKKVVVEPMFNLEESFVNYLKELSIEALSGQGNLIEISDLKEIFPPTFLNPHE